jgi:hypothetical protein
VAQSVSPWLRSAAAAFCPPFAIDAEGPPSTSLVLRNRESGDEIVLRYRSERGLFLRTYFLVAEADVAGGGPPEAGELVLRRGKLRWKGRKQTDAKRWREQLASPALRAALGRLQVERLSLGWEPTRETWRFTFETLSGSLTATFFPPLMTPNPLERREAEALVDALGAVRNAAARRPA